MKQSLKSKAINAFIIAIVNALFNWVRVWNNGAYFFILIGDQNCSDVAWSNPDNVESYGGHSIAMNPEPAALFESMRVAYDVTLEESRKNKEFEKIFQDTEFSQDGWFSDEYESPRKEKV